MTRVNLIPPICLYDQHLIAEWREIPRIPNLVKKLLETKGTFAILKGLPEDYTLGKNHVRFFYDKLQFIKDRHDDLKLEGKRRGINLDSITIDLEEFPKFFKNNFEPSKKDVRLSMSRIKEKIDLKPSFYKYHKL